MEPAVPQRVHAARPARYTTMDIEDPSRPSCKRSLTTTAAVSAEWKSGSKKRVIKYYVVYAGIGLIVGAIIGVVIGVCVRFT
jgi:hypothetical protein